LTKGHKIWKKTSTRGGNGVGKETKIFVSHRNTSEESKTMWSLPRESQMHFEAKYMVEKQKLLIEIPKHEFLIVLPFIQLTTMKETTTKWHACPYGEG
jgi:hypothetical protein